jgi:hypothetical protein
VNGEELVADYVARAIRTLESKGCPQLDPRDLTRASSVARAWEGSLLRSSAATQAALSVLEAAAALTDQSGDTLLAAVTLGERHSGLQVALTSLPKKWALNELRKRRAGRQGAKRSREAARRWVEQAKPIARGIVFAGRETKVEPILASVQKEMEERAKQGPSFVHPPTTTRAMRAQLRKWIKQAITDRDNPDLKSPRRRERRQP